MTENATLLVRLPPDMKQWLKEDAKKNDRNMNSQIVAVLRERMNKQMPETVTPESAA